MVSLTLMPSHKAKGTIRDDVQTSTLKFTASKDYDPNSMTSILTTSFFCFTHATS